MYKSLEEVLDFWLSYDRKAWFQGDANFDEAIREHFFNEVLAAREGQFDAALQDAKQTLGLMLLLDQFPRNLFRGKAEAFVADAHARFCARKALEYGHDHAIKGEERIFFYMPFEHSESILDQALSVCLFHGHGNRDSFEYALIHYRVIARFGRFPHRNGALSRIITPAEQRFLDAGGFSA